jgi:FixJ family two-component response regulator
MPGSGEAVAVVEDDPGMREALQRVLRAAGFEAVGFGSAEEFLARPPADLRCLVLDVHLPGVSGPDLQRRLVRAGTSAPVIFITAHDSPRLREEVGALHPVAFLSKPFEGDELVEAVDEALSVGDA